MSKLVPAFVVLTALTVVWAATEEPPRGEVLFREEFADTNQWKALTFPKIDKHSTYAAGRIDGRDVLICRSDSSASGLILKRSFDVRTYCHMRWRWRVENILEKGDARKKQGDDYPIRLHVVFKYDPKDAGPAMRAKYGLAKKRHGEYPPHSGLNYIWANREHKQRRMESPYTSRSVMIISRSGREDVGKWVDQEANVLDDYRKAFGADPPDEAMLVIMTDSDNTGESTTAYVDFVEVIKPQAGKQTGVKP